MLKTSGSTESTTRPGKGGVGVGGDGGDDGGGCSGDSDRKFHPRLQLDSRATHLDAQRSSSTDSSSSAVQVVVKHDGLMVVVASRSKSCQKVEESSKRPKNLKGLKNCKGHRFGGTFTEAPVLRQLYTKNSSFR